MKSKQRGFTLLEALISMVILAFIAIFTVQSMQRALKQKTKMQKDIDKNSTVRDALRVMERDINMAFNYRDPNIELYNLAQKQREEDAKAVKTNESAAPVDPNRFKRKTEKVVTQFVGEPEALSLTTLSNIRLSEDSPISSQAEIGYRIKPCRRRSTQEQSSKCLWRRVANYIHEDITKEGQETVLLENIMEFKLRYLGPGRNGEWVDTWITSERGDDQTKNKFPFAVEITVEVKDTSANANDKSLRMTTVASLRNPNNPKEEAKPNEQPPGVQ